MRGYLEVAKGEITRLDYIVTQFLQAIRPAPLLLKPEPLNDVVLKTLELLLKKQRFLKTSLKFMKETQVLFIKLDPKQFIIILGQK